MSLVLANAPVSYGVFELTVGTERYLPPAEEMLDALVRAGYQGVDLGPLGYLGAAATLGPRLAERSLGLAGAYIELPFDDAAALDAAWPSLDATLDVFDGCAGLVAGRPVARPTLAAAGSPPHQQRPGQSERDHSIGLDGAGWARFTAGLRRVLDHCRARGYEPAFHHHAGTAIEAPWEIDRLLASSDVGLCFDTGHLLVGGGDPVKCLHRWASRIKQVHIKDARRSAMDQLISDGAGSIEIWTRGIFCALGGGDLDIAGVVAGLGSIGYSGWMVVEQDTLVADRAGFDRAVRDQRANRDALSELGL